MSLEPPFSCCVYLLVVLWDFCATHFDRVHSFNLFLYSTLPCPPQIKPSRPMWAIVSIWRLRKNSILLKRRSNTVGFLVVMGNQLDVRQAFYIWDASWIVLDVISFSSSHWPLAFWLWFFCSCKCCHHALAQSDCPTHWLQWENFKKCSCPGSPHTHSGAFGVECNLGFELPLTFLNWYIKLDVFGGVFCDGLISCISIQAR